MKRFVVIVMTFLAIQGFAQQSVTLDECYRLVAENYPLGKQQQLLEAQNKLNTKVTSSTKLPQINFDAQATYQSDVIEIPIPNSTIEPINKDQYRATLSVNQLIYDGGLTRTTVNMNSAQLKTKQKQVEVNLYQLKLQINQLYYSILLSQEAEVLLRAKQAQLSAKLNEVEAGVKYGVILPSSDMIIKAELLKIDQQFQELKSNKMALIETLSSLIGQTLDASTLFQTPMVEIQLQQGLQRPELELFQIKKEEIASSEAMISRQNTPKLLGFATGGYGNPGLNFLDNSFQAFYTVGVKMNWKVFDWNSNRNKRRSLAINKDLLDNETEVFKLHTGIELNKQLQDINKIEAIIATDQQIINLRKDVLQTADSQLKNGVITSSAYITELTNLYEDQNTLVRHTIELQLAKANYNVIKG